jgi:hypothetical protein
MKRKLSIGDVIQAFKKTRISRKGANKVRKIKTRGLPKPKYGLAKSLNFGISARDKQLLGMSGKATVKPPKSVVVPNTLGRRLSFNPNF